MDPGSIAKSVAPALGPARFIPDADHRGLSWRQCDRLRDSFRSLAVSRGRFAVDQEREIAVARLGGGEFEPDINRLRDLRRVFQAVVAAKIDHIGPIPEQSLLLRLVAQFYRDLTPRRLDQVPAVRAPGRVIINRRMRLDHDGTPPAGDISA